VPELAVAAVVWALVALGLLIGAGAAVAAPTAQAAITNVLAAVWAAAVLAHRAGIRLGDSQHRQTLSRSTR
jgi:hypothetical protein